MSVEKELKARLAEELCALVADCTVAKAAAWLHLWPSEVSALRRGRYAGFSIDRLVRLIAKQRYNIELSLRPIEPKPAPRVAPTIVVVRYDRFGRPEPAPDAAPSGTGDRARGTGVHRGSVVRDL